MTWYTIILETYKKGLKYDELEKELKTSNLALIAADHKIKDYTRESAQIISQLSTDLEKLKVQIKELLSDGILDLESVKKWYENKYSNIPWLYNYDGKGRKDVKFSLSVTKNGEKYIRGFCLDFIEEQKLTGCKNPNMVVEKVIKYFMKSKNWKYNYDINQFGKVEFWQKADKSLKSRIGDCDDLAILMYNVIYYLFDELGIAQHQWRLKLTAGGTLVEGHCFNIWLHDDGEWYVIESTLDLKGSFMKTWLKTPIRNNNLYKNYWGFARKDKSWAGTTNSLTPYTRRGNNNE